jgi:hypothetical protein
MLKILLTGTTKSGKSTLLEMIHALSIPKLQCIPEVARELLTRHPELEQDPHLQDILFAEITRREKEAAANGVEISICDRGTIDILTHLDTGYFGQVAVKQEWREWSRRYDQIYVMNKNDVPFTQTDLQSQIDSERNWALFRDKLDHSTHKILDELHLPYSVLSGTPETRLHRVESELQILYQSKEGGKWPGKER